SPGPITFTAACGRNCSRCWSAGCMRYELKDPWREKNTPSSPHLHWLSQESCLSQIHEGKESQGPSMPLPARRVPCAKTGPLTSADRTESGGRESADHVHRNKRRWARRVAWLRTARTDIAFAD